MFDDGQDGTEADYLESQVIYEDDERTGYEDWEIDPNMGDH